MDKYMCKLCNKTYYSRQQIRQHVQLVHDVKPHKREGVNQPKLPSAITSKYVSSKWD